LQEKRLAEAEIGIDATRKWAAEGSTTERPVMLMMPKDVKAKAEIIYRSLVV
jgi:4-hydroxy-3-polyprenylbenzoate decarboxylase